MKEAVILVHGLWMSGYVCSAWRRYLLNAGFDVYIFSYPSVKKDLEHNSNNLWLIYKKIHNNHSRIHFVGHSLGGIVIMNMLKNHRDKLAHDQQLGRVVLCGSPIQGSNLVKTKIKQPLYKTILGKTITQWKGIEHGDIPKNVEIGTLMGERPIGMGRLLGKLSEPNDGTVTITEAYLPWANDKIAINVTHSEMLYAKTASAQITHFLKRGGFVH